MLSMLRVIEIEMFDFKQCSLETIKLLNQSSLLRGGARCVFEGFDELSNELDACNKIPNREAEGRQHDQ